MKTNLILISMFSIIVICLTGCTATYWQRFGEVYRQNLAQDKRTHKSITVQSIGNVDYYNDNNGHTGTGQKISNVYYYEDNQ